MTDAAHSLVLEIRAELRRRANPERAPQQQAYMKSRLPFHGLSLPETRAAVKPLVDQHGLAERDDWARAIRELWDEVTHREEWYAALTVARHRRYRAWREDAASLPLYQHLIRAGAWWDVCDEIANHLVGPVLAANREAVSPIMREWANDPDLWIRRVAILSQLKARDATDRALLADCIAPSLDDPDFFLRKGIGWALREFSKTDPDWVRDYVEEHRDGLSPLSTREALRLLKTP